MTDRASAQSDFVCILNGAAGSNRAGEVSDHLADLFAKHRAQTRILLARDGVEIAALAHRAIEDRCTTVVVGGGDGTVSRVAAALIDTETTLGVLPLGTFNHFAKDLKIPLDLEAAVANIFTGRVASIDMGEVNGRPFVNNSSHRPGSCRASEAGISVSQLSAQVHCQSGARRLQIPRGSSTFRA